MAECKATTVPARAAWHPRLGKSAQISRHMERLAALRKRRRRLSRCTPTSSSGVGRLGDGGCCAVGRRSKAVSVEESVPIGVKHGSRRLKRGEPQRPQQGVEQTNAASQMHGGDQGVSKLRASCLHWVPLAAYSCERVHTAMHWRVITWCQQSGVCASAVCMRRGVMWRADASVRAACTV